MLLLQVLDKMCIDTKAAKDCSELTTTSLTVDRPSLQLFRSRPVLHLLLAIPASHAHKIRHCKGQGHHPTKQHLESNYFHQQLLAVSNDAYFFASMPVGGVHSVFFLPISFQLVDSTVPLDSCIRTPPQHMTLQSLVAQMLHHLLQRVGHIVQTTLHL